MCIYILEYHSTFCIFLCTVVKLRSISSQRTVRHKANICNSDWEGHICHDHIQYDKRELCTCRQGPSPCLLSRNYCIMHANVRLPVCVLPVQTPDASIYCSPLCSQAAAWLSLICHQIIYTKFTCIVRHSSCYRFVRWNKSLSVQFCMRTTRTLLALFCVVPNLYDLQKNKRIRLKNVHTAVLHAIKVNLTIL